MKRWLHWGGRATVLRCDEVSYADILFIRCSEEETHTRRLSSVSHNNSDVADAAHIIHSLHFVTCSRPYGNLRLVTNPDYSFMEIMFELRFSVRQGMALFVSRHCVAVFAIPTRQREEFFIQVQSSRSDYQESCLLFASTPIVFA